MNLKHEISWQGFKSMQNTVCSKKEWEKKIGKRGQEEKKVGGGIFEVLYTIYGGNQQKGFQENL